MQVALTLNVDDSLFNEYIATPLKMLSQDDVKPLLLECLGEYMRANDYAFIKDIVVTSSRNSWGDWITNNPSSFTTGMLATCDFSALQDVVDKAIEYLKDNTDSIINKALAEMLIKSLDDSYSFRSAVQQATINTIREYKNG